MKTKIFAALLTTMVAFTNQAESTTLKELPTTRTHESDPTIDNGVSIYPSIVTSVLNIEIDEKLAGGSITVSVFNSMGEIVLENVLGLGLNKVDTSTLPDGNYVAVVRQNDVLQSKSAFEVK